jgi:hypothetical protein
MKVIDLPPFAPTLIESTRAIGYSLKAAIADILDNSISANAGKIDIGFFAYGNPYIAILDNGYGMDDVVLTEAMRYGSNDPTIQRDSTDLGRYGLGMKTASLSQCRCLTVASKTSDGIHARRWDLDFIKETGSWSLQIVEGEELETLPMFSELDKLSSGTLVVWQNLDRVFVGEFDDERALTDKMEEVRQHLSLVFHRFLPGGDAKPQTLIKMNGEPLIGFDPFFISKSRPVMEIERIEIPQYNSVVTVWPVILPHPSKMTTEEIEKYRGKDGLRSLQGFYVYRNKRLLIWGTWFRLTKMDEFSKLARVRIDIPNTLDDLWTLDVKKSTAMPPEIVKFRLKQLLGRIIESSKHTYTFRGRRETRGEVVHLWQVFDTREGVRYELNDKHPLYERLSELISDKAKQLLDEYAYAVAMNFPINKLHNDIYNEKKIVRDDADKELAIIKQQLRLLLSSIQSAPQLDMFVASLLNSEPYCKYKDEINVFLQEEKQ